MKPAHGDIAAFLVFAVLCLAFGILLVFAFEPKDSGLRLPHCPEDEVIVGVGSFTGFHSSSPQHGQWTDYVCGPARDSYKSDHPAE